MALRDLGTQEMTDEELEKVRQDEEDEKWWNENSLEISEKYKGSYVAIVNKDVLVGETYQDTYEKAKRKYPDREPLVEYIPLKREVWVL